MLNHSCFLVMMVVHRQAPAEAWQQEGLQHLLVIGLLC